jgi:hypothetical protein
VAAAAGNGTDGTAAVNAIMRFLQHLCTPLLALTHISLHPNLFPDTHTSPRTPFWFLARVVVSAGKKVKTAAAAGDGTDGAAAVNAIMWFRQDLRIHDNPALVEAANWAQRRGGSVVCVYVHSPSEDGDAVGTGSRWAGCFYGGG